MQQLLLGYNGNSVQMRMGKGVGHEKFKTTVT